MLNFYSAFISVVCIPRNILSANETNSIFVGIRWYFSVIINNCLPARKESSSVVRALVHGVKGPIHVNDFFSVNVYIKHRSKVIERRPVNQSVQRIFLSPYVRIFIYLIIHSIHKYSYNFCYLGSYIRKYGDETLRSCLYPCFKILFGNETHTILEKPRQSMIVMDCLGKSG